MYNKKKDIYMAFCKFSKGYTPNKNIVLDSVFVRDYMPVLPDVCTKVYLFGLYKCQFDEEFSNTLEVFAKEIDMKVEDVIEAFYGLQEQELFSVINIDPIEVRYLPVREKKFTPKMFKEDKYTEFNKSIQEIIEGRMLTPTEFREYYYTMESLHIEPSALLMIAKYCTHQKGSSVGYNYILTVAKNWAYEGVRTAQAVENKLQEMELVSSSVKDVLVALKSKRQPNLEDKELFSKWTKQYGFEELVILHVAKKVKKGGMTSLGEKLDGYYASKIFSISEIDAYEKSKEELFDLAKSTCKMLGAYYPNLDPIVNNYIIKWQQMGYSKESIEMLAKICFKKYVRDFEEMDAIVAKYYAKGLVSIDAINEYISGTLSIDKKIKEILRQLQLSRQVTSWDRDFYHTWSNVWQMPEDVINYALSFGVGKTQPMHYVNKILSSWKENGVKTLQEAQNFNKSEVKPAKEQKQEFMTHSFSSEELNALFDNLDEVKLV